MSETYRRLVDRHLHMAVVYVDMLGDVPHDAPSRSAALSEALAQRLLLCVKAYACEVLGRHRKPIPLDLAAVPVQDLLSSVAESADAEEILNLAKQNRSWFSALLRVHNGFLRPQEPDFTHTVFAQDSHSDREEEMNKSAKSSNLIGARDMTSTEDAGSLDLVAAVESLTQLITRQRACSEEY